MKASSAMFMMLMLAAGCAVLCPNTRAEEGLGPASITTVHPQQMRQLLILHRKADELVLKNDFRGAIRTYSDILLIEPDDETAYVGLGQAYLILGDYPKAKDAFQNALHIDPDNDTAVFGLQKIMDPDGVAGMVTPAEAEGISEPRNFPPILRILKPLPYAPAAKKLPPISGPLVIKKALPDEAAEMLPPKLASITLKRAAQKMTGKALPPKISRLTLKQISPAASESVFPPAAAQIIKHPLTLVLPIPPVETIQKALKNAGLYKGPLNGKVNPAYEKAIKNFQLENHLTVDGVAGHRTWAALQRFLKKN